MPYTGNPLTNNIDALRLEVGDIDVDFSILTDNDYNYFLMKSGGNKRRAALDAAKTILFVLSRLTHERTDVLEVWGHEWVQNYRDSLKLFISDPSFSLAANMAMPYAGGISKADIATSISDADAQTVRVDRSLAAASEDNPYSEDSQATNFFEV
jgi:hypothetical protein